MRVPLLRLDSQTLIVPLHGQVHDDAVLSFQEDLAREVSERGITGVVVDVSAMDIIDSYMARILNDTGHMLRLLGAHVVLCGIQPAVALVLVEMGHDLLHVPTAFNLERALLLLRGLVAQAETARTSACDNEDDHGSEAH